jgi:hypothetical protein
MPLPLTATAICNPEVASTWLLRVTVYCRRVVAPDAMSVDTLSIDTSGLAAVAGDGGQQAPDQRQQRTGLVPPGS